jgi:glycosyltransferase involved in cell wall biosynthesis
MTSPLRLLITIPALGSVYGGPSKIALELADALSKQAIHVDLVTTNANGDTNLDVPLKTWIPAQSYRIQYFSYLGFGNYKISGSLTQWLFHHIKDYDLVHTIAVFSYPVAITHWLCQRCKVPYIMNPQGMLEPWALAYKAWKKQLFYALFEKAALQNASALQMLSTSEAQRITPLQLKTPIVIVSNGLHRQDYEILPDSTLFYHQFPETQGKTLLLFLARIDPKKGLDLLASAFAIVHRQFPKTHLIVAGQDNIGFLPTAKNYFAQANCLDAVTFTGMLTGGLKYAALAAADLYVAPSYSEGFSMSVLEGMASGLPCVITTGCNFPEAKTADAAHVVDVDAGAIAHALITCLKDPQKAKAMGDRARQLVLNHYNWDRVATQLIDVYSAILDHRPLPAFSPPYL